MLSDGFKDLEQRVRALEDETAIARTLTQYAHCIDQGVDAAAFADCFTDDAIWHATIDGPWAGQGGSRHEGRQEILRWFDDLRRFRDGQPGQAKHYVVAPSISIEGDRATAETYHLEVSSN